MCCKQHSAVQETGTDSETPGDRIQTLIRISIVHHIFFLWAQRCCVFFCRVFEACSAFNIVIVVSCLELSLCLAVWNWLFCSSCFECNTCVTIKTHITNFIGMPFALCCEFIFNFPSCVMTVPDKRWWYGYDDKGSLHCILRYFLLYTHNNNFPSAFEYI